MKKPQKLARIRSLLNLAVVSLKIMRVVSRAMTCGMDFVRICFKDDAILLQIMPTVELSAEHFISYIPKSRATFQCFFDHKKLL